jgi:hypothetical protein
MGGHFLEITRRRGLREKGEKQRGLTNSCYNIYTYEDVTVKTPHEAFLNKWK